jgi:hypothetical protein
MIPFFRKIRWRLAANNQFLTYSRYALGEIVLVVIGILIALYINNWNESRKENEKFKLIIEQIYNEVDIERAWLVNNSLTVQRQINLIDSILLSPQNIPDSIFPYAVFYVDLGTNLNGVYRGTSSIMSTLDYSYEDLEQLKVSKQIRSFADNFLWNTENRGKILEPLLNESGIPTPNLNFSFSEFNNFSNVDKTFFLQEEIDTLRSILSTQRFQTALRSLRSSRSNTLGLHITNSLNQFNSLMKIIEAYHPGVRLLYKDIGIVGSALETGWDETIFMSHPDANKSIWVIDINLNDGHVKFRSSNSWTQNWGGNGFPSGDAIYYWEDIPVKKGPYRVTLNLEERTYSFLPLEN